MMAFRSYVFFLVGILLVVPLDRVCFAQSPKRPTSVKTSRLDAVKAFGAKAGVIVFAEVDPATVESLSAPTERPTAPISANHVAKVLGCNAREKSGNQIYFQRTSSATSEFRMGQAFTNDMSKLSGLNKLLQSFSPEQWQRLQDDRGRIPAGMLTGAQKGYLTGFMRPAESPSAVYEFDFRTWMGTRTADGVADMRVLKRTAPKQ
jgi:hypothetical protein